MQNNKITTVIDANAPANPLIGELTEYRRLIYFFTWREFKVRYKQTALGVLWVALQPLVFMGIVQLILLRRLGSDFGVVGAPAYISVFLGFVVWQFFEGAFSGTVNGFVSNQNLYKKIYFPKIIPSIAFILSRIIDLIIGFGILLLLTVIFGYGTGWEGFTGLHWQGFALFLPLTVMMSVAAMGAGLLLGTLNVKYRDVKQVLPFVTRMAFLSTPIFWPISIIPESFREYIYLNPAAASIQTFREAFYDPGQIKWSWLLYPVIPTIVFFAWGLWYYRRKEHEMVDIA